MNVLYVIKCIFSDILENTCYSQMLTRKLTHLPCNDEKADMFFKHIYLQERVTKPKMQTI